MRTSALGAVTLIKPPASPGVSDSTALSEFPLAGEQTLQHLVDIVPGLGELTVEQVPPIQVLLQGQGMERVARYVP